MRKYSDEVLRRIKNGKLKCEKLEIGRLARTCGLSYGYFKAALSDDGIQLVITDIPDKRQRKIETTPEPPHNPNMARYANEETKAKMREAMIKRLPRQEIVVYNRITGEEEAVYGTFALAAEALKVSEPLIRAMAKPEYQQTERTYLQVGVFVRPLPEQVFLDKYKDAILRDYEQRAEERKRKHERRNNQLSQ